MEKEEAGSERKEQMMIMTMIRMKVVMLIMMVKIMVNPSSAEILW